MSEDGLPLTKKVCANRQGGVGESQRQENLALSRCAGSGVAVQTKGGRDRIGSLLLAFVLPVGVKSGQRARRDD